jgi:hypothetical protein
VVQQPLKSIPKPFNHSRFIITLKVLFKGFGNSIGVRIHGASWILTRDIASGASKAMAAGAQSAVSPGKSAGRLIALDANALDPDRFNTA